MLHRPAKFSQGFTLIELLIVVSLSVIIMLAASSLFMTLLIGNTKTSTTKLIKDEGDYALSQMEFLIRNATNLESITDDLNTSNGCTTTVGAPVVRTCDATMCALGLESYDGGTTILGRVDDNGVAKIASNSGYLTSDAVTLISGPVFSCSESPDGVSRYIGITFTLRKGTPGVDQPRDIVQQVFSTGVQIRNI